MSKEQIKIDELTKAFNSVTAQIQEIESNNEQFLYATHSKYIAKIGYVGELSMQQVAQAAKYLNDLNVSNFTKEMEQLGISQNEMGLPANDKHMGIKLDTWFNDLKTRVAELRNSHKLNTLRQDEQILKRNLNGEDRKVLDLQNLSNFSIEA